MKHYRVIDLNAAGGLIVLSDSEGRHHLASLGLPSLQLEDEISGDLLHLGVQLMISHNATRGHRVTVKQLDGVRPEMLRHLHPVAMASHPVGVPLSPARVPLHPVGVPLLPVGVPPLQVGLPLLPVGVALIPVSMPGLPLGMALLPVALPSLPAGIALLPMAMPRLPVALPLLPLLPVVGMVRGLKAASLPAAQRLRAA